jgi:hypothetical protein
MVMGPSSKTHMRSVTFPPLPLVQGPFFVALDRIWSQPKP